MATVTGFTAERMAQIEAACIVGGAVVLDDLVLTRYDGIQVNAGDVRGPSGPAGPQGIQGIQGPQGNVGPQGPQGPVGTVAMDVVLPSSPSNNQECYYIADGIAGIVWHLKYRTSLAKWLFMGGSPLFQEIGTSESIANSAAYGNLATVGPYLTAPLAGLYEVSFGTRLYANLTNGVAAMSIEVGGVAAVDADAIYVEQPAANVWVGNHYRVKRKTFAANGTVYAKYRGGAGHTAFFQQRWMSLKPVSVS